MTKQKIVIKVTMPNHKSRSLAMALTAKANGVISMAITGDQLEVVGDGVDITCLVKLLRKKLCCHADILKVEEVKDNKKEEEEKKKKEAEEKKKKEEEEKKKKQEAAKLCACPAPCRCASGYALPLPPTMVCYEEPPAGLCHIM